MLPTENNRDTIVGIKIAMSKSSAALFPGGPEKGEKLFYDAALEAAGLADVPLMCHHTFSTVPLEDCPGNLRKGDVYTHTLHGFESTIVQPAEGDAGPKIHPAVHAAKRNGVVFVSAAAPFASSRRLKDFLYTGHWARHGFIQLDSR